MKKLLIIPFLLSLTACGIFAKHENILPIVQKVNIDAVLLEPCGDLLQLKPTATFNDVLLVTKDNTLLYAQCKEKHQALTTILRKSYE